MAISRWAKAAGVTPGAAAPPPPAASAEPSAEAEPIDVSDTLLTLRRMQSDALRIANEARGVGNMGAAQRAVRDAAALGNTIARVERSEQAESDVLRLSRADIELEMQKVLARVQAITARPLLCAACSRALSVRFGRGEGEGGAASAAAQE